MISVARVTAPRGAPIGRARSSPGRTATARRASTSAPGSRVVVVRARVGTERSSSSTSSGATDASGVSRRAALAGKALFTLGEAFIFPWATEGATRPKSPATADLAPFSPAWLSSILYTETDPDAKASAKAALLLGEALQAEGKHAEAVEKFEEVYALAPTEYKMCQRAGLRTAVSYKAMSARLGDEYDKKANDAKQVVWWWGRGTRWPGWYIVAYLSARNVWFETREDPVGAFTATEGLAVLVPIWLGLLYALVTFGIPDY